MRRIASLIFMAAFTLHSLQADSPRKNYASISKDYVDLGALVHNQMLGISPDGSYIVIAGQERNTDRYFIRFIDGESLKIIREILLKDEEYMPFSQRAVWSDDGRFITFTGARRYPPERLLKKRTVIYSIEYSSGNIIEHSGRNNSDGQNDGQETVSYYPFFAENSDEVFYHRYKPEGQSVIRNGGGKDAVMFSTADREKCFLSLPLANNRFLINVLGRQMEDPDELFLYNAVNGSNTSLFTGDMKENFGEGDFMLEVREMSRDRHAALVQRRR